VEAFPMDHQFVDEQEFDAFVEQQALGEKGVC
jgi:hypothetical protein